MREEGVSINWYQAFLQAKSEVVMQIDLPNDATQFIEQLVASGEYPSADDALVDGVRLLMARKQLQAVIQKGIGELDAGDGIEADRVFAELRQRSKELAKQAK